MSGLQHIKQLKSLAKSLRKASDEIAKDAGCELVDSKLLKSLMALRDAVEIASKTAMMTRDYTDCHLLPNGKYNGKRWLVGRSEFDAVLDKLHCFPNTAAAKVD